MQTPDRQQLAERQDRFNEYEDAHDLIMRCPTGDGPSTPKVVVDGESLHLSKAMEAADVSPTAAFCAALDKRRRDERGSRPEHLIADVAKGHIDADPHLRHARDKLELTSAELGGRVGLPTTGTRCRVWEAWERGEREPGRQSRRELRAIAEAIRGARDDRGEIDWNRVQATLDLTIEN